MTETAEETQFPISAEDFDRDYNSKPGIILLDEYIGYPGTEWHCAVFPTSGLLERLSREEIEVLPGDVASPIHFAYGVQFIYSRRDMTFLEGLNDEQEKMLRKSLPRKSRRDWDEIRQGSDRFRNFSIDVAMLVKSRKPFEYYTGEDVEAIGFETYNIDTVFGTLIAKSFRFAKQHAEHSQRAIQEQTSLEEVPITTLAVPDQYRESYALLDLDKRINDIQKD